MSSKCPIAKIAKKKDVILTAIVCSAAFSIFFNIYNFIQKKKIKKLKRELREVKKEVKSQN